MSVSNTSARKVAKQLNQKHAKLHSWRLVAGDYQSPVIKAGTLNRIANTDGEWLPCDEEILIALGLMKPRKPKPNPRVIPKWEKRVRKQIATMAKQTRVDLGLRK